jgi:hypothetical protein
MADPRGNRGPVMDQTVARSSNYGAVAPAVNTGASEMDGLLRGLSGFNRSLGGYTDQAIQEQWDAKVAERDRLTKLAEQEAAAAAARMTPTTDNLQALSQAEMPTNLPVAYSGVFRESLGNILVDRAATKAKATWATEYEEASKSPDFNADSFIKDFRTKHLAGIQDPALVGRMGLRLGEMEGNLLAAAEKQRVAKLEAEVNTGLYSAFEENFRADMTPEAIASTFMANRGTWEGLGKSKAELSSLLLTRVSYMSAQKGGDPDVFSVFNQVDPDTKQSLLSLGGPQLQAQVATAIEQAKAQQFKKMEKETNEGNLKSLAGLNELLEKDPSKITLQTVTDYMGDHSVFKDFNSAAAFLHRAQVAAANQKANELPMADADAGMLGRYEPAIQKKVLEAKLGPAITRMWQAATQGDEKQAGELASLLLQAQSQYRSTESVGSLERLLQTVTTAMPNPQGPDATFKTTLALYKGLSSDPAYREKYFKEDTATLMEQYDAAVKSGVSPDAAYVQAYQSISKEAKATAEKYAKTPEFQNSVTKALKEIPGSSMFARWVGGNGRVTNPAFVEAEVASLVRGYMARNPNADQDAINAYAGRAAAENFVMDTTTGAAVRVPTGMGNDYTKEAVSAYSANVKKRMDPDGEYQVQFRPMGNQGQLNVVITDGHGERQVGITSVADINAAYTATKSMQPAELDVLNRLKQDTTSGNLDSTFVEANAEVIAKAKMLKVLPSDVLTKIEAAQLENVKAKLRNVPKMSLGQPTLEGLQFVPTRGEKVDNKLTADIATRAATSPAFGGAHSGLAASLVTMGEAVMLRAYPDPNPAAGMNIGMGYNLKANAKNYKQDFIRAGVAPDMVEAVAQGKAQLTPTQAEKLLMVTMPRYEKQVKDVADKTAPGLWNRMTSAQKAVMTDIAWQTGDPAQFKKAWSSLASGDMAKFKEETRVFYNNSKGEKVEDKRRNDLRAAMLNGDAQWMSVVRKYGGYPSNAIEAYALNTKS